MNKRQSTLMALAAAALLTQILCTAALLRCLDRSHKEAAAAQARSMARMELQWKLARQAKAATKTVQPDAPPAPPDNSISDYAEDPIPRKFSMPAGQVPAMSPEQFVDAYAQKMEFDHKSGSYCGGSYRSAMVYYAQCLRKHSLRQTHRLPRSRYHKFLRAQKAIEEWLSSYYDWNMLFNTDGTFWCSAWADDSVAQQQTISCIASDFRKTYQYNSSRSQEIPQVFKLLNSEIENFSLAQVYQHENDKRFVVLRKRVRKATTLLEQEVNSLPPHSRSITLTFVKKVRLQVLECVSPFEG